MTNATTSINQASRERTRTRMRQALRGWHNCSFYCTLIAYCSRVSKVQNNECICILHEAASTMTRRLLLQQYDNTTIYGLQ